MGRNRPALGADRGARGPAAVRAPRHLARAVIGWRAPSPTSTVPAFLGWLVATATSTILALYVTGLGVFLGPYRGLVSATGIAVTERPVGPATVGLAEMLTLVGISFLSYYTGGYLSGRLAPRPPSRVTSRGIGQGVRTWLWAVVAAVVITTAGWFRAGSAATLTTPLTLLNSFPPLPIAPFATTIGGVITAVALASVSLGGAMAGGIAGVRRTPTPR